jgi:hypothetical protein
MDKRFTALMNNLDTSVGVTPLDLENIRRNNVYNKVSAFSITTIKIEEMKHSHAEASAKVIRRMMHHPDHLEIDRTFKAEFQMLKDKMIGKVEIQ